MRTKNSIKNITISIISQIIMTLLGFISRKVFLDNLGIDYLGVNGLLTNVLSLLALLEGGIGSSITYNLYKPLAENDEEKITALIQLYKKAYMIIAAVVLGLSISLFPILSGIMTEGSNVSNIFIVYIVFVMKNVMAYLYAHKWSLINADQKNYILARRNLVFSIITTISKIVVLVLTQSYVLFLIIEVIIVIIQSILNGKIVDKLYPYIKTKKKYTIEKETKINIINNVKALFLHNVGSYCVFGTDNILISKFVNVSTVGIYSNYTMIINQLVNIIAPVINGVGSSVGNLIATESKEKNYSIFKVTYLVNFWIYSFCVIFLYNLLNPFINWWLGEGYLLDNITFFVILMNCYITGMRSSIGTFKTKAGIFVQDKYMPLIESIINLGASLILIKYFGLLGVFLGTTISTLCIVFWNVPRLVYKYVFKRSSWEYFIKYFIYALITIIVGSITTGVCNYFIEGYSFMSLIYRGCLCVIIPNTIYLLIFYKTSEFKYLINIMKNVIPQFVKNRIAI